MLRSTCLLARLQDAVNELIPECALHVGFESPAWHAVSTETIARLHNYLKRQYPEAGARYWRARSWGLLIWQPIYLAVIAAHRCQIILPLNEMGQDFPASGIPSGVLFRHSQFTQGQTSACVQRMAQDLMRGCRHLYSSGNASGLTQKNAERVVADCVVSALLMVYPTRVDGLEELGNVWLTTMGLEGAAGFIHYQNIVGESRLALDKKNCCFRYLCHGRAPCDICPRQTLDKRLQRLSELST